MQSTASATRTVRHYGAYDIGSLTEAVHAARARAWRSPPSDQFSSEP
jgi:hypothetical protein